MWFRKRRRKTDPPRPGNTTAVVLAHTSDPADTGTAHEDADESTGGSTGEDTGESAPDGTGRDPAHAVDGCSALLGDPMVRWVARSAAAATSRTVLILADGADTGTWRAALGHTSPVLVREQHDDTLRIVHVPQDARPVAAVQAALGATRPEHDPYLLLLDSCRPLLGPDVHLALIERLGGHDAVAFHLDAWWVPLPSLWRHSALTEALAAAETDRVGDLSTLLDRVDGRPLGEENLAMLSADPAAFRPVRDEAARRQVERRLAGRGADTDAA